MTVVDYTQVLNMARQLGLEERLKMEERQFDVVGQFTSVCGDREYRVARPQ